MSNQGDGSDEPERDAATHDEAREPEPAAGDGDSFNFQDEYQEAFGKLPELRHVLDDDGLPKPAVDDVLQDAHVPPFLPETNQICVADLRQFVVRDEEWGEVIASFPSSQVGRAPDGRYRVRLWDDAAALLNATQWPRFAELYGSPTHEKYEPIDSLAALLAMAVGGAVIWLTSSGFWALVAAFAVAAIVLGLQWRRRAKPIVSGVRFPEYVEVEPIRPVCAHYLEQLEPVPESMKHAVKFGSKHRYCTVKRSTAGAFFGLKDEAMLACSMRDPVDSRTLDLLEQFDIELAEKSRTRTHLPMFKLQDEKTDADLAAYRAAEAMVLGGAEEKKEKPSDGTRN